MILGINSKIKFFICIKAQDFIKQDLFINLTSLELLQFNDIFVIELDLSPKLLQYKYSDSFTPSRTLS